MRRIFWRSTSAVLRISTDDRAMVSVNENKLSDPAVSHGTVMAYEIAGLLKKGRNILELEILNVSGPTAVVYEIEMNGRKISSATATEFSFDGKTGWTPAHCFGKPPAQPWKAPSMYIAVNNEVEATHKPNVNVSFTDGHAVSAPPRNFTDQNFSVD